MVNREEYNDIIAKGIDLKLLQKNEHKIRFAGTRTWRTFKSSQDYLLATMFVRLVTEYGYDKGQIQFEESVVDGTPILYVERSAVDQLYIYILDDEITSQEYQEYCRRTNHSLLSKKDVRIYVMYATPIKADSYQLQPSKNLIQSVVDIPAWRTQKLPTYKYIYQAGEYKKINPHYNYKSLSPVNYETLTRCFKLAHY